MSGRGPLTGLLEHGHPVLPLFTHNVRRQRHVVSILHSNTNISTCQSDHYSCDAFFLSVKRDQNIL